MQSTWCVCVSQLKDPPHSSSRHDASSEQRIAACLQQLAVAPQRETLRTLADLAAEGGTGAWAPHAPHALRLLLGTLTGSADAVLREAAAVALGELCGRCPSAAGGMLGEVVEGLLQGYGDRAAEVAVAVDDAACKLIGMRVMDRCLSAMLWNEGMSVDAAAPVFVSHC